ncbi:hypothetical protein [Brevundimonas diminuta]|uniref:hypothetical protein n=1 Tax=Brevundimonas diminuta TaxID=293 RepID=UPI0025A5441B|nr:hypothetical protein [Brevundimonas diminuta]MDM8352899.1 hypothetical protein [Brevundimonas diminuta]
MALPRLSSKQPIAGNLVPTTQFLNFMEELRKGILSADDGLAQLVNQLEGVVEQLGEVVEQQGELVSALAVQIERLTRQIVSTSYANGLVLSAVADGATAKITISAHTRVYTDGDVSLGAAELTGLEYAKIYAIYYDDPSREGGAVDYQVTLSPTLAVTSDDHPTRHLLGTVTTPADGSAPPSRGGGVTPPGFPGGTYDFVEL